MEAHPLRRMADQMMLLALLTAAAVPALPPNDRVISCDDKPVYLVVAGPTLDRTRMLAYGKAIADSGMYQRLGGYYINSPGAFDLLEGTPPKGYTTLIVRFPCRANALAFWNSRTYQETIKPMRLNPSAGDYTVSIYPETALRGDMVGKVGTSDYLVTFEGATIPARPIYAEPKDLVLGVDVTNAPVGAVTGGWPGNATILRDDRTGSAMQLTLVGGGFRLEPIDRPTEIYVLAGALSISGQTVKAGDLVVLDQGLAPADVVVAGPTTLLLFRDAPTAVLNAKPAIAVAAGDAIAWAPGLVAKDAGAASPLMIKRLRTDPATGARTHLVRLDSGAAVPWEVHSTAEEGYLLSGDYHLEECLPTGRRAFDYRPGGYFYRPASLLHSGPQSGTKFGSIWLIRTPRTLDAVFYPSCPVAPAAGTPDVKGAHP